MNSKKDEEKEFEVPTVDGIPVRTSLGEFSPGEMFECGSCHRVTPPNRMDCIYCGAQLVLDENQKAALKPVIRPPAEDADGSHLIYFATVETVTPEQIGLLREMTRLDAEQIKVLVESGSAVPLARGESGDAVEIAAARMRESGMDVGVFSDAEFESYSEPLRMRGISVEDDGQIAFILFNNDEVVRLSGEDVELIVVGLAIENTIEANEKHKGKSLKKVIDTTELSADQTLIDIYVRARSSAYRIQPTGFDFSFLGADKGMIAAVNLNRTIKYLREFAENAVFDESYKSIRAVLDHVWPVTESQDTKKIKRTGFGGFEKTRVTKSSNLGQFTRYSGLQRKAFERSAKGVVRKEK